MAPRVRHYIVAFDISLGESAPPVAPSAGFDEFCDEQGEQIARVLSLACNDTAVANAAIAEAFTSASQRWKHLCDHVNQAGWLVGAGLQHTDNVGRASTPTAINRATGGYVRGLELADALDALPLYQRAALITGYHLGWSDEFTAAGFEVPVATVTTRRTRAVSFVAHHLRSTEDEAIDQLRHELRARDEVLEPLVADAASARRRGTRRTVRNRTAALILAALVIIAGGALFRADNAQDVVEGPEPVVGPRTSPDWFDPVSDGGGDFVALNTSGPARFAQSTDGADWFEAAVWNSRAVDIRLEVSAFNRTGGRYLAVLEAGREIREFLPPRVATSMNLVDWNVRQIEIDSPAAVEGLRRGYRVVAATGSNDLVLVALEPVEEFDHRSFDIRADDVCGEQVTADRRHYHLCDGEAIIEVALGAVGASTTRYFLAADNDDFREVELPPDSAPRSVIGFGGGFAVADANQGQVWLSSNGVDWERATTAASPNRFVLLEGDQRGALVIEPDNSGWKSRLVAASGLGVSGDIPLEVAPSGVWSQPAIASGPAGWALFVTTSRPWERPDVVAGWAVATPSWIVSRQPDAATITAQSVPDGTTLRLAVDGPWVQRNADGTTVLRDPSDNSLLVEVTEKQIEQSRPAALDESQIKAQVFFSPDGISWTSVWSSTVDAWSGSVAVGDDEVLLSGTQLTAGPITIEINE